MKFFMKNKILSAGLLSVAAMTGVNPAQAAEVLTEITSGKLPVVDCGSVRRFTARSAVMSGSFTVDVWLPEGYVQQTAETYPVVYMHDGQNLFDPSLSYAGAAWEVDKTLGLLISEEWISAPIIVGIHNRGTLRPSDYVPEKPAMDYISEADREASGMWSIVNNKFYSDEYMQFIATELKPAIDQMFATRPGQSDTFIMGSSMGGLASIYAMCEYPDIFGGAACLSTHWIGNFEQSSTIYPTAVLTYLSDHLPSADNHKLYLDRGTLDLDSYYEPWEDKARELIRQKGYSEEKDNLYVFTHNGATHNEVFWAQRVDRPLHFLLKSTDRPYTPMTPEMQEFHVIFQDDSHAWTQPRAFAWAPGVLHLGNWPGTPMTPTEYDGRPAWEIRFSHTVVPTNIIFDNGRSGSSNQTADLDFHNHGLYDFFGVKGVFDEDTGIPQPGIDEDLKIYVVNGRPVIDSSTDRFCDIYSADGLTLKLHLHEGINEIPGLAPGIYFIAGKKIVI